MTLYIHAITFYLFATVAIASAVMVISARNPVHSVLFLILTFFTAAALFVLQGAEFIAMLLVIVYVGAVAVLFLFVVMMLDINFVKLRQGFLEYLPIGAAIGLILVVEMVTLALGAHVTPEAIASAQAVTPDPDKIDNTRALGQLIYTHYAYLFQASGLVLLVAMIGAIVLTHRKRPSAKKQKISDQVNRDPKDCIEIRKVETGKGI